MFHHRLRALGLSAVLGLSAGLVYGLLPLMPFGDDVASFLPSAPVASAQPYCGQPLPVCNPTDLNVTSGLDVYHRVSPGGITDDPVQLNNSERVTITAYWSLLPNLGACSCGQEISQTVTIDPTLSGTSWTGTCTGCNAGGPIYAVVICDINADDCLSYDGDYRLNVNVVQSNGGGSGGCAGNPRFLNRVEYTITNINNGDAYDASTCVLGAAVSPTTNSFTATDFGAFECAFNCEVGPSLTVTFN